MLHNNAHRDFALMMSLPLAWVSDPADVDAARDAPPPTVAVAPLARDLRDQLAALGVTVTGCYAIPRVVTHYFAAVRLAPAADAVTRLEPLASDWVLPAAPLGVHYGEVYFGCDFQARDGAPLAGLLAPLLTRYARGGWPGDAAPPAAVGGAPGAALLHGTLRDPAGPEAWVRAEHRLGTGGFCWCDELGSPVRPARLAWTLLWEGGCRATHPARVTDHGFAVGLDLAGGQAVAVTVPASAAIAAAYAEGAAGLLPFDLDGALEALRDSVRGLWAAVDPACISLTPAGPALPSGRCGELLFADPAQLAALGFDYAAYASAGGGLPGVGAGLHAASALRRVLLAVVGFVDTHLVRHASLYCCPDAADDPLPGPQAIAITVDYPLGLDQTLFTTRVAQLRAQLPCGLRSVPAYDRAQPEGFILNHPHTVTVLTD